MQQQQGEYGTGKKIYTYKVNFGKGYNVYKYLNPYQFIQKLNLVIKQHHLDIQFVQAKYFQTQNKDQRAFQLNDSHRYDFQIQKDKNNVFKDSQNRDAMLEWIYGESIVLKKPENNNSLNFDQLIQNQKKKDEIKKIQEIDDVLALIMDISQDQRKDLQVDSLLSFDKYKNFEVQVFKDCQYNIFVKAKMSQPVKDKLQEWKQAKKSLIIKHNNIQIKCYLNTTQAFEESGDKVQEQFQISSWTMGCFKPSIEQRQTPQSKLCYYFSTQKMQQKIQKINRTIRTKTLIALHKDGQKLKSFQLQTYFFNQTILKTVLNMGQIKSIQICNKRTQQGIIEYYFYLAYPPKLFISRLKRQVASVQGYITTWQRIENIFLLRNKKISQNDFLRLYLFNNSILKIQVQKNSYGDFQNAIKMLDTVVSKFDDKITVPITYLDKRLNFEWRLKTLQTEFDAVKKFADKLHQLRQQGKVWVLKYFILIMARYNHLVPNEISRIIQEIQLHNDDLDVYIYVFWKIATDIWGYNDKNVRFADYLFNEVKSAKNLNRKNMMKNTIKNSDMIVHVFRLNSSPSGFLFAPPTPQMKGRLTKQFHSESQHFMRVAVCDDHQGTLKNQKYITKCALKTRMSQMNILGRKYIPLGWSPSQLRAYSLWYINESNKTASGNRITRELVLNFLGNFDTIQNPAKRAARIGQSFSASWTFDAIQAKVKNYIKVDDIYSQGKFMFTDGIGKISKDLIDRMALRLGLKDLSIIQIRYLGAKGLLVLDEQLPNKTIVLRPSMIKYQCEKGSAKKYLDILDSNKYKAGFLNRQIIILLKTLKIKDTVFEQLHKTHIINIEEMSFKDCSVFKQMNEDLNTDINNLEPANKTILQLVRAGFNLEDQPFFRGVLETMKKNGYNQLKAKCNIRVQKSARIIGIIDQFGVLNENQVYCAIYDPFSNKSDSQKLQIIDEQAIITRNPCLDPADIRKVTCIGQKKIQFRFQQLGMKNRFHKFINCVIFPQKGKVPLTAQISGSDLDGDNFFICWDPILIPKEVRVYRTIDNPNENKSNSSPAQILKQQDSYKQMLDFFFEYINYEKLGQIDNSHLIKADLDEINYADNPQCMKLCQIHGKAVDFPKTGYCPQVDPKLLTSTYPDFMQKYQFQSYPSLSILGKLYREIKQKIQDLLKDQVYKGEQQIDQDLLKGIQIDYNRDQVQDAMNNLLQYEKTLDNLIQLVGIDTEYQIYSGNFSIAKEKVDQYGKTRLISTILMMKQRYFAIFFDDLQQDQQRYVNTRQENLQEKLAFSDAARKKAILYYLVSYIYKFGDKLKYPNQKFQRIRLWVKQMLDQKKRINRQGKFCGFIWFIIPKIIINIKKLATVQNKKMQSIKVKQQKPAQQGKVDKAQQKKQEKQEVKQDQDVKSNPRSQQQPDEQVI